jgi:hypothetical protein
MPRPQPRAKRARWRARREDVAHRIWPAGIVAVRERADGSPRRQLDRPGVVPAVRPSGGSNRHLQAEFPRKRDASASASRQLSPTEQRVDLRHRVDHDERGHLLWVRSGCGFNSKALKEMARAARLQLLLCVPPPPPTPRRVGDQLSSHQRGPAHLPIGNGKVCGRSVRQLPRLSARRRSKRRKQGPRPSLPQRSSSAQRNTGLSNGLDERALLDDEPRSPPL